MVYTAESIAEQVQTLVLELLPDVGREELTNDVDIFSLGLDSINAMTLVSNLQEAFDFQLDVSEINFENFQNIGAIADLIEQKKVA